MTDLVLPAQGAEADLPDRRRSGRALADRAATRSGDLDLVAELLGAVVGLATRDDVEAVYARIADLVAHLVDYQLFGVMLWCPDRRRLETVFARRGRSVSDKTVLEEGVGLCGAAAASRRPVRVGDVRRDPRFVSCGDDRVRSELVVPLVFEDRLLGVLDLESHHVDAFTETHERILSTLASNVAVALENVQLHQRLKRDERRLAKDLETARGIQHSLLPRKSPWLPGLRLGVANVPARELGGDVYDFFGYGGERTAVAVGDVAGKGTAAALYGSMTIGLLRGYIADNRCDARCVLTYLNEELRQLDVERRFLALTFAVYDHPRRVLELANAGLPYPWLVRDGVASELELGGVPLGAMAHSAHRHVELELRPGDRVVFATDGFEECRDADGEPFGADAVGRVLEAHAEAPALDLAGALVEATDRHLGPRRASDDRTAVVLEVRA